MSSSSCPSDLDGDDEQNSSSDAAPINELNATEQWASCLNLIERVREQSGSIDPQWYFGSDTDLERSTDPGDRSIADRRRDPPERIGRFEIIRRLGQGGYGIVLLAVDPELNRRVALKLPNPEILMRQGLQRQFLREGEAAAALNHPHIVTVHEAGQIGTLHYIASEYVDGGTLAEWLKRNGGRIQPYEAAELVKVLAGAVQHAHARGVLHRDIKPANVLIDCDRMDSPSATDLADAARLTDFGLARMEPPHTPQANDAARETILGTPAYMSPEQAEGRCQDVDATSDVYALGVLLYELLAGRTPFKQDTRTATLRAICQHDLILPSRHAPNLPSDLEAICLKSLEYDQAARYPTAAALAEDLRRFLDDEAVTARRATTVDSVARWCRRNPAVAALSLLVSLMTLVIAVGSSLAAIQLNKSRQEVLDHLEQEIVARDKATSNEELALRTLFEARVAQARAGRRSRAPGQRLDSLDAVKKAAALIPRLELGKEEVVLLRNEAIACMALVDLAAANDWPVEPDRRVVFATDADVDRYAHSVPESGDIVISSLSDRQFLAALRQPDVGEIQHIVFSPDGEFLACTWDRDGKLPRVQLWRVADQTMIHSSIIPMSVDRPFDFNHDGQYLAVARQDGSVEILQLRDLSVVKRIAGTEIAESVRISPDGSMVALCRPSQIEIFDLNVSQSIRTLEFRSDVRDLAWSPHGTLLAAAHDGLVTIWRTNTGLRFRVFSHPARVDRIFFHPTSGILGTYCGYDFTTRLWDVNDGNQLLSVSGESTGFSRDGGRLGRAAGRWQVVSGDVHRSLLQPVLPEAISAPGLISVHKDGRLMATSNRSQTIFWDLARGIPLAEVKLSDATGVFSPNGSDFIVSTLDGLIRRSITRTETDTTIQYRLGTPQRLAIGNCGELAVARDGNVISCVDRYHLRRVSLYNTHTGYSGILEPHHASARWLDVSPGGELLATGAWRGENVHIWNTANGELLRTLSSGSAKVKFSSDGTRLAIDEGQSYSIWNVSDWTTILSHRIKHPGSFEPGSTAFSPDDRMLAILTGQDVIQLLDTTDFSEIASFRLPYGNRAHSLKFSPSGDRLIAGVRGNCGVLHVWDLQDLRNRLTSMGLDWNLPPLTKRSDETSSLSVTFDE